MARIKPLWGYLWVKPIEKHTTGMVVQPDAYKEKTNMAKVLGVDEQGFLDYQTGDRRPHNIEVDDVVVFREFGMMFDLEVDGIKRQFIPADACVAVLKESQQ